MRVDKNTVQKGPKKYKKDYSLPKHSQAPEIDIQSTTETSA
jgi:hypothetical protein